MAGLPWRYCLRCGNPLRSAATTCRRCGLYMGRQAPLPPGAEPLYCWSCGTRMHATGLRCEACGALKEPFPRSLGPRPDSPGRRIGLPAAAVLLAAAGVTAWTTPLLALGAQNVSVLGFTFPALPLLCASLAASVFALYGAYLTWFGDSWAVALGCSVLATFAVGPAFIGTLMAAAGVLLVATGRDQFLS